MNFISDLLLWVLRSWIVMLLLGAFASKYEWVPALGYVEVLGIFLLSGLTFGAFTHAFWAMRHDLAEVGRIDS